MKFEIIWSDLAEKQLDEIYEYYLENASYKVAGNFVNNILKEPDILVKNPSIGQIEQYLPERKEIYRYIIFKSYKIIYSVDDNEKLIKIADVFDTRQNPLKITRKK